MRLRTEPLREVIQKWELVVWLQNGEETTVTMEASGDHTKMSISTN